MTQQELNMFNRESMNAILLWLIMKKRNTTKSSLHGSAAALKQKTPCLCFFAIIVFVTSTSALVCNSPRGSLHYRPIPFFHFPPHGQSIAFDTAVDPSLETKRWLSIFLRLGKIVCGCAHSTHSNSDREVVDPIGRFVMHLIRLAPIVTQHNDMQRGNGLCVINKVVFSRKRKWVFNGMVPLNGKMVFQKVLSVV